MWAFGEQRFGEGAGCGSLGQARAHGIPSGVRLENKPPAEGFTQWGNRQRRRRLQPQKENLLHRVCVCLCMHVCTYIIHVHRVKDKRLGGSVGGTQHMRWEGEKGVGGAEEAPACPWGAQVLSGEAL